MFLEHLISFLQYLILSLHYDEHFFLEITLKTFFILNLMARCMAAPHMRPAAGFCPSAITIAVVACASYRLETAGAA